MMTFLKAPPFDPAGVALSGSSPPARLLGNGHHVTIVTATGTGFSAQGGVALTRGRGDRVEDADGLRIDVARRSSSPTSDQNPADELRGFRWRPGSVEIARVAGELEWRIAICVPPVAGEAPPEGTPGATLEVRRVTVTNRGSRPQAVEISSFAEVVLVDRDAFESHPAFSKLFLQTEFMAADRTLLVSRRARAKSEEHPWLFHTLHGGGALAIETDRARCMRRGPVPAMGVPARRNDGRGHGSVGAVLDPVVSLRTAIELPPGDSAEVAFLLGAATTRAEALTLSRRFADREAITDAFARAHANAEAMAARLALSMADAEYLSALAGAIWYRDPRLGARGEVRARARRLRGDLLPRELLDRRKFVLLDLADSGQARLFPDLGRALRYWHALGLAIEAVIIAHDQAALSSEDGPPGLHMVDSQALAPGEQDGIAAAAALVLEDGFPDLTSPVARRHEAHGSRVELESEAEAETTPPLREPLRFWNSYGGFNAAGDEYVIRMAPAPNEGGPFGGPGSGAPVLELPPRPWVNVIAQEQFGCLVSETGAGTTWSENSRLRRLTPWRNDPLCDPHDEAFYIRDEDTGRFWSPLPGPAPLPVHYEMRHGFGYSTCQVRGAGLEHEVTIFVPLRDRLKVVLVRLTNLDPRRSRRLTLFGYYRLVLGTTPEETGRFVVTAPGVAHAGEPLILFATNLIAPGFEEATVFAAAIPPSGSQPSTHFTGDRAAFIGQDGSMARPAAIAGGGPLDGRTGAGLDPCFALSTSVELMPGATTEVCFLLGEAEDPEDARALVARYAGTGAPLAALSKVRESWRERRERIAISTPSPALDLMVNGWLPYQTLSCRLWGRSAFYQSGGAFGFRDQLQDAAALAYHSPELTRAQILLHAAHQFVEGDVLHWWHPPQSLGLRTRCSDDLLWLPYITAFYIATTDDWSILDEPIPFLNGPPLAADEDEILITPTAAGEVADLYTHCCRAIDRGVTSGAHGLPLFGTCDWNDGMNRVGREGRGESVWLGFFAYTVLGDFLPLCARRDDTECERRYGAMRAGLATALNDAGWDGDWYRRGYYDSGAPLGSRASDECRIDALAQAWSVISGVAPVARAVRALEAVEEHLVSDRDRMIRLLTPAFDRTAEDPGYIKGYVPGARENGGQYTHAALWVVKAMAELRRPERAAELFDYLNPIQHAATRERADRYQVEPYVIAADIHGVPPHVGRGGWTWYTGSAGWMIRVALESILGFRIAGGKELVLTPCVPKHWERFAITYRPPDSGDTCYEITALNPGSEGSDLITATLDGAPLAVMEVGAGASGDASGGAPERGEGNATTAVRVPLVRDGCTHRVELVLGARAAVPR